MKPRIEGQEIQSPKSESLARNNQDQSTAATNGRDRTRMGAVPLVLMAAFCWLVLGPAQVYGYPPTPHHVIYGLVRDDFGTPLMSPQAQVVLETPGGVQIPAALKPGLGPGVNYQLQVPMDAGLTADLYEPNALVAAAPFKIFVVIGQVTNLPIQMAGNYSLLGQPGKQTRIDLTVGVDSNGDGIPDAWEMAYLAAIGSNLSLAQVNAGSVLGPDGLTILQEYLAGYYPFDPADTFLLKLVNINGGSPVLQFTAITGRTYTVLGSNDLYNWVPLSFLLPSEGPNGPAHSAFVAPSVATVQVQALQPTSGPQLHFFKLSLQ